jgi:RHS repeat-associated protein
VAGSYEYHRYEAGFVPFWTPLRFPGQYYDAESDLFENWNRYYEATAGRYLGPEPILLNPKYVQHTAKQGHSVPMYDYALGNPLANTDPTGRVAGVDDAAVATAAAAAAAAALAVCYALPECRKNIGCFMKYQADLALCTVSVLLDGLARMVRGEFEFDTGDECARRAQWNYFLCKKGWPPRYNCWDREPQLK